MAVKALAPADSDSSATAQTTAEHDAWFRAKVREALEDSRPGVPHDDVEAHFARRRAAALRKAGERGA